MKIETLVPVFMILDIEIEIVMLIRFLNVYGFDENFPGGSSDKIFFGGGGGLVTWHLSGAMTETTKTFSKASL